MTITTAICMLRACFLLYLGNFCNSLLRYIYRCKTSVLLVNSLKIHAHFEIKTVQQIYQILYSHRLLLLLESSFLHSFRLLYCAVEN